MQVKIKSITPRMMTESNEYEFLLEVEAVTGDSSRTVPPMLAETVLDYQRCRAAVAKYTGWLLKIGAASDQAYEWESILGKAWQDPETQANLQEEWELSRNRGRTDPDGQPAELE